MRFTLLGGILIMIDINWEEAPEGATHLLKWGDQKEFSYFDGTYHYCTVGTSKERASYILDGVDPWVIIDEKSKPVSLQKESDDIGVTCFDLMFFGCQDINAPQAIQILNAIKADRKSVV